MKGDSGRLMRDWARGSDTGPPARPALLRVHWAAGRTLVPGAPHIGALEQRLSQGLDEVGEHWGRKLPSLGRTNVVRWRSDAHWGRKPPPGPPPFGHWVALGPALGQENTYWGRLITCPNAP